MVKSSSQNFRHYQKKFTQLLSFKNCFPAYGIGNAFLKKQRGWVSKLFCVLNFSKIVVCSLIVGFVVWLAQSGCCFLWVYRYNKPGVFDQSQRTYYLTMVIFSRGKIFTCGLKMFTWRAFIKKAMIRSGYDIIFRSQSACNKTFIHVA